MEGVLRQRCGTIRLTPSAAACGRRSDALAGKRHTGGGCFFLRAGHIAAVEMLPDLSDQEAIAKAHKLFFLDRRGQFEGFELWDRTRVVFRHPDPDAVEAKPPPAAE
jgi:hypothetical protein